MALADSGLGSVGIKSRRLVDETELGQGTWIKHTVDGRVAAATLGPGHASYRSGIPVR